MFHATVRPQRAAEELRLVWSLPLAKWGFGVFLLVNWLSFGVERVAARQHFDPADAVAATLMNQQAFVLCDPNVADDPNARGDRPALEHLSVGVKTDQRVWPLPGFVIPDHIVNDGDGIGV